MSIVKPELNKRIRKRVKMAEGPFASLGKSVSNYASKYNNDLVRGGRSLVAERKAVALVAGVRFPATALFSQVIEVLT